MENTRIPKISEPYNGLLPKTLKKDDFEPISPSINARKDNFTICGIRYY